jgi:hypothetical protein
MFDPGEVFDSILRMEEVGKYCYQVEIVVLMLLLSDNRSNMKQIQRSCDQWLEMKKQ